MISSSTLYKLSKSDKIIQLLKDHYNLCDWDKVTEEDFYTCISTEIPETVMEDGKRIVQVTIGTVMLHWNLKTRKMIARIGVLSVSPLLIWRIFINN